MDDVELRGRVMAIEMLLVDAMVTTERNALDRAKLYLDHFPDVLAADAPGFGGPEVVASAHVAMRDIWRRIILASRARDKAQADLQNKTE